MAGALQFSFTIFITLIATGLAVKDCEECPIEQCNKIENSGGNVYGENDLPALSAGECPDEQNCCNFENTLYYSVGERAPCGCPKSLEKAKNNFLNEHEGAGDSTDDMEAGDTRSWRWGYGLMEKEALTKLSRAFPNLFTNPNLIQLHLNRGGMIKDIRQIVPELASEKSGNTKKKFSYRDLFAKESEEGSFKKQGEIVNLLEWQKKEFPKSFTADNIAKLKDAADDIAQAQAGREQKNKEYRKPDKAHILMQRALEKAENDMNEFLNDF